MKKVLLLTCLLGSALGTFAQYNLTGASPYTQDFNSLTSSSTLPTGWKVYSGSSATSIGTLGNYSNLVTDAIYNYNNDTTCGNVTGGFKNYPSANNASMEGASCTAQKSATDRALGVRQVSPANSANPNLDSGAAFVFQVSNTGGITNLGCTFKLQSIDSSSPRITTWKVQYRIGSSGTWTGVTTSPATLTTGGLTFSNTPVTVSFGSALNNSFQPVWIRIVTLDFSSSTVGSGNRASTAIDDFNLTWTGTAGVEEVGASSDLSFSVIGAPTSSDVKFAFDAVQAENYTLVITDLAGRNVYSQNVAAERGTQQFSASGLSLAPGMYIASLGNGSSRGTVKFVVE